jgi:hypothetical protein
VARIMQVLGVMVLIWVAVPAMAADRYPVGRVVRQEGTGAVVRDAVRSPLIPGTAVFRSDVIETGPASRITVQFTDNTTLGLGPESRVAIADYAILAGGSRTATILSLLAGIVRAAVHDLGLGGFEVRTDVAVASARSTEWTVEVTPTGTAVLGLDGTVEVASLLSGASVLLVPGTGTDVRPGADPTQPVPWGKPRIERTLRLVGPPYP